MAFGVYDFDPEAYARQLAEQRRTGVLRRSWEMLKGIVGTVANVPGAATGVIAGAVDPENYWKAYEEAIASTGRPESELTLPEILRVAPGVGEVATAGWEPESPLGQAGKTVATLAGNMATDPLTYATGGLASARRALALRRAGQLGLVGTRTGLLGAEGAKGILPHVVGGVLASPITPALAYGEELVGSVGQGLRQAYEGAREGDLEKILAGGLQTAAIGGLGAGMAGGLKREFRPLRSSLAGVRARRATQPVPEEAVQAPVRPPDIWTGDIPREEVPGALGFDSEFLPLPPTEPDILAEARRASILDRIERGELGREPTPEILSAAIDESLARQDAVGREIPSKPMVQVPDVEDLVARRLEDLRARDQRALPPGDQDVKAAEHGASDVVTSEAVTKATQKPPEEGGPIYAYRVRDVGELGVPSVESHSQFSMSEIDVRKMAPSRSDKPQEVIRINLKNFRPEEYREIPRPDQPSWLKMERPIDESEVEVVGKITEADVDAASKAALTPGLEEAVRAIENDPDGIRQIGAATGLDEAQVRRGIAQVKADKMEEFGPEAIAVKRAILAAKRHEQFALDNKGAGAQIVGEESGAGFPAAPRIEPRPESVGAGLPSPAGIERGAPEPQDRGLAGLPGRAGARGEGRGVVADTGRPEVRLTEAAREAQAVEEPRRDIEKPVRVVAPIAPRVAEPLGAEGVDRGREGPKSSVPAVREAPVEEVPREPARPREQSVGPRYAIRPKSDLAAGLSEARALAEQAAKRERETFGEADVQPIIAKAADGKETAVRAGDPVPPGTKDIYSPSDQDRLWVWSDRDFSRDELAKGARHIATQVKSGTTDFMRRVELGHFRNLPVNAYRDLVVRMGAETPEGIKRIRDYSGPMEPESIYDALVETPKSRYAVRPSPLGFYSRLARVVDDTRTPAKGKASDLLRFLKDPKRQVKKDELYWTGLEDYLKAKGDERVTREEVAQFLSEREVKVSEKTLGLEGKRRFGTPEEQEAATRRFREASRAVAEANAEELDAATREFREAERQMPFVVPGWGTPDGLPKFSQWQEPGGENYREVLLTLPTAPRRTLSEKDARGRVSDLLARRDKAAPDSPEWWRLDGELGRAQDALKKTESPSYTGGHFKEPNVLVHLRLNDRVDADGKKVLFVEEIQSDWAQKGRKEGFQKPLTDTEVQKASETKERLEAIAGERTLTGSEVDDLLYARHFLQQRTDLGIPRAPFVEDTEAWTSLALKRIFRMAAEEGYDKVAWTTGAMQASRYDLSKQLDSVEVKKSASDDGYVIVGRKGGSNVYGSGSIPREQLADHIGKDLAEKALNRLNELEQKPGGEEYKGVTFSGLDLKVGGEGMKGYYDEIVPQLANKIGKQWGAKVGETDVGTASEFPHGHPVDVIADPMGAGRYTIKIEGPEGDETWGSFLDEGSARREMEKMLRDEPLKAERVPSIDITPQMRESVMLGQPLFAARPPRPAVDAKPPRFVEVKSVLGSLAEKGPDNSTFYLKTPAGRVEIRWTNETIRINHEALKAEYGEGVKPEDVEAVGVHIPWEGLIKLRQGAADLGVVGHEAWHAVKDGMRMAGQWDAAFDDLLRKRYKTEAEEADAFASWAKRRAEGPRSVFERVAQWVNRMLRAFMPDWRNVFERSFQSAAEGPAQRTIGGPAPAYAVRPERINPDTLTPAVLDRMSRALKAKGFDIRGGEDVRSLLKGRMLDEDGKLWHEDWQDAYKKAISGEETRKQKATDLKARTSHVLWENVRGFPTTQDPRKAGYVRPDGKLADMSSGSDVRADDHRIVGGTAGMQELVGAGWIRWMPEGKGLDIGREPSTQQYRQIRNLAEQADGEIVMDLQRGLGEFDESNEFYRQETTSLEYPKGTRAAKIIGDIKRYYSGEDVESGVRYAVKPRATGAAPKAEAAPRPIPGPEPQGAKGEPIPPVPRVEQQAEAYERLVKEATATGAKSKHMEGLDRDDAQHWTDLDGEIEEIQKSVTDEQLYNRATRRAWTPAEAQAFRARLNAKNAYVLQTRAAHEAATDEFTKARTLKEHVAAVLDLTAAVEADRNDATGTARALAARARIMDAELGPGSPEKIARQLYKQIPGISSKDVAFLLDIQQRDPSALQGALQAAIKPNRMNKFIEWYKAGLLSAPGTHIANISGNTLEAGTRVVETALSSLIDRVLQGVHGGRRERWLAEAGAEMAGAKEAFGPALGRLMGALRGEVFTVKPEKIDLQGGKFEHQVGAIGGKFGRGVRTPFRALGVADDFFKDVGGQAELFKLARRKAASEEAMRGKSAEAIRERASEIIREALDGDSGKQVDLLRMVAQSKLDRTFQTRLSEQAGALPGFARFIQDAAAAHPLLQIVVPFIRTPANIAQATIARSPLGWANAIKVYRQFLDGKVSRGDVADAMAKPLLGSAIIGGFAAYAAAGGMTGSGPTDPDERNLLRETGWQPYSFVIPGPDGKIYVPYNRFEPVSSLLGLAADISEIKDQKKAGDIFDKALGSLVENLTSKTYLTGLSSAAALISRPKQFAGEWVRQVSRGMVPNLIGRAAQAVDPVLRDVKPQAGGLVGLPETAAKTIASRLPFVSKALPARRSATGEEITRKGVGVGPLDAAARFALPVQPTRETADTSVQQLLIQTGFIPSQPSRDRTVKGRKVRVGDEDYEKLQDANAWAASEIKRRYVGNATFESLPDTMEEGGKKSKEFYVRRIYDEARERGAKILNRSADWRRRVREATRGQAHP